MLKDLKTNFKSLKYGNDRFNGGNSSQPYIQVPIPDTIGTFDSLNQDFIIRGGLQAVKDSLIDVERLGKFFADTKNPSGLLFIAKQNVLSRVATRTQASTGILNEGIYTPLGTLAEAGLVAFGGNLNKQGLDPFEGIGKKYTPNRYFDAIIKSNTSDNLPSFSNIDISGVGAQNLSPISLNFGSIDNSSRNRLIGLYQDLVITNSPDTQVILSYKGGPGSELGIGRTNIKFATDNFNQPLRTGATGKNKNPYTSNTQQLEDLGNTNGTLRQASLDNKPVPAPKVVDFRDALRKNLQSQTIMSNSPSYDPKDKKTLETRTNLGDPGNSMGKNLTSYTNGYSNGAASPTSFDKINALPLYKSEAVINDDVKNDLIKFRIGVIDNNNPSQKTFIHFRAFLNNISDNFTATQNATQYIGRGENFYTYGGFERKVSLSWTVAAQSKVELIAMYKKLNYLASVCAPDYSGFGFMRGNIITLTIGGYFYEQPGLITGFNYEMNDENDTWEIAIDDNGNSDDSVKELPHLIKVTSFNFIPIHTFVPRKQQNTYGDPIPNNLLLDNNIYGDERYIALANGFPHNLTNNDYGS